MEIVERFFNRAIDLASHSYYLFFVPSAGKVCIEVITNDMYDAMSSKVTPKRAVSC